MGFVYSMRGPPDLLRSELRRANFSSVTVVITIAYDHPAICSARLELGRYDWSRPALFRDTLPGTHQSDAHLPSHRPPERAGPIAS